MGTFILSYNNEFEIKSKYEHIKRILSERSVNQCTLALYNSENHLNYIYLNDFIETIANSITECIVSWRIIIDKGIISEKVVDLLKGHKFEVTFIFNEENLCLVESDINHNENYTSMMENINKCIEGQIPYDVLVIFNDKLINNEENFAKWVYSNNFDISIIPQNSNKDTELINLNNNYPGFLKTTYKLLYKKQHYKVFNPVSHLIIKEKKLSANQADNNDKNREEDFYLFKDENISTVLNIFLRDDNYYDEIFTRYRTQSDFNYFITVDFKKRLESLYDILRDEGIQDLKNSFQKRQIKPQIPQVPQKEEYDILLTLIYRGINGKQRVPIGLNLLSAYIGRFGYTSKVLDISSPNLLTIFEDEIENKKTKIIGLYCSNDNKSIVGNSIKYLKRKFSIITFVGGPQAVALGEDFLRDTGCDVITEGEGEEALKELMDYFTKNIGSLNDIKNIKFIDENNVYHENEIREPIKDLDSLPFPKIIIDKQSESDINSVAYILTGRGCPFRCTFCYEGANSRALRYRSIENTFEEINQILKEKPKIWFMQLFDDTFTLDHKRVSEFCEKIKNIREKRKLYWCCEAHINTLYKNPQLINQMIEAGLFSMQFGIESGSPKVLEAYKKHTTPEMICDVIKMCNDAKLGTLEGNIIVGGAHESEETIEETIDMVKKLIHIGGGMLEFFTVFFWPFPKTPITKCPEKYGIHIIGEQVDQSLSCLHNAVTSTEKLSRNQIILAKNRIDNVIEEEYKKTCLELDKSVILKIWSIKNDLKLSMYKWGIYAFGFEHLKQYCSVTSSMDYTYKNTSEFENLYPIRTFNLLEYVENKLVVCGIIFDNIKMRVLELSTGRYTISQMAKKIGVDTESVIKVCMELENKCFLYFSNF